MKDVQLAGHVHGPGLPEALVSVALPPLTRVAQVNVTLQSSVALTRTPVMLAPVAPPRRVPTDRVLLRRTSVHRDAALYRADARAPRPMARLIETQQLGEFAVAHLSFCPVLVNADQSLSVATQCEITLVLQAVAPSRTAASAAVVSQAQRDRFSQLAQAAVLNPEAVAAAAGPRLAPLPVAAEHLIITDNHIWDAKTSRSSGTLAGNLPQAFARLVDWRQKSGLASRVVTVSDIVNQTFGDFSTGSRDLQHTIRKFLVWAQATWGVAYVLLGGSHRVVPARSIAVGWMVSTAPSDFYYANLGAQDDWLEGARPDYKQTDFCAHVSVGRVAVETAAQADIFVTKVIEYERLATSSGMPIATDYLHRALVVATSWNREVRVDLSPTSASPPLENTYFHATGAAYAVIKLYEALTLPRFAPPGLTEAINPDPNTYTHIAGLAYSKLHLLEAATYKEVQDVVAVLADGRQKMLTYRKDAGPGKPGWYFDLDTTNFIKVFGSAAELEPSRYIVHLKPAFREAQNLLRRDQAGDTHLIPYDHHAPTSGLGWCYVRSATDPTPSAMVAGLPAATPWIAVYDQPANLSAPNLQRYILDPMAEEGSMADQEALRKQMALELPEWDEVHRLYEDQFDLPAGDRSEPALQQFNTTRFRELANAGQHAISLSGHGWMDGCCAGVNNALADALSNGARRGIVYADSCLTARFTDNSLSTHFALSPLGGAVGYVGYTDESEMGLSKFFQRQFFRGLSQSNCMGIAFDTRTQLLQPTSWDYDPGADGPRRMILIGSLAGDPAMRLTLLGEFALKTAGGQFVSATAGGGRGGADALRSDAAQCGAWETFTLVPQGGSNYALRTLDGHHLTVVGGGGRGSDAVHSDQPGVGPFEAVQVVPRGGKTVSLGTPNGQLLSAAAGGGRGKDALRSDAASCGSNELFTLVRRHGAGLPVYLRTAKGNYLTAMDGGARSTDVLHSNAAAAGPWERFVFVSLGCGEYALRTRSGRYLSAVDGGGRTADAVRSDAANIGANERFTVVPQGSDQIVLQTCSGNFLTVMDGGGRTSDVVHTNAVDIGPWERLTMVAVCTVQTSSGNYLTAEGGGGATANALHSNATAASVFERFTLLPLGTPCALQTPDGHYLTAVGGGGRTAEAIHSDAAAVSTWERFTVVPLGGGKVALQTVDGHYLTAVNGGGRATDVVHTDAVSIGPWEQYTLVAQAGGQYALKTASGHYLTAVGGGGRAADAVHSDTMAIGPHERLLVIPLAGEQFALRTSGGQFVTAVDGGGRSADAIHTDARHIGPFERFTLLPMAAGRFALQTHNGSYVTAVDGGGRTSDVLHTDARSIGPWEMFSLMPG
jgi:hypothetical protein